ncbi:MAG: sodium:solute symporter family protein [Clostridia bacterium]|nr:sodium:solute symporter family protein [Clostridia bacterium]
MDFKVFLLFSEVVLYFVLMVGIGLVTKKWISSISDFFISGREVSAITIGLGLSAIMFSGATLPAISGLAITHGVWIGSLYMWGWAAGIIIFGKTFAPAIRRSGVYTLPEWAQIRFDEKTRTVVAVATSMAAFGSLFAQVVGLGNNLTALTGIPYWATTLVITVLCTFYMYAGGFWALSISDMAHMIVIMIALVGSVIYLIIQFGDPITVFSGVAGADWRVFSFIGKADFSLRFPSIPSLVFGWLLTMLGCQYYWMRAVGGRSEKAVKRGYCLSALITCIFGSTLLAGFGIYALHIYGEGNFQSGTAFGMIVRTLPLGMDGLMLVAMVAACMSTFSTALLGVSSPILRDVFQRFLRPNATAEELVLPSRIITLGVAAIAWMTALLWKESAALALAAMWAFSVPTAVVLVLAHCSKRITNQAGFLGVSIGIIVTVIWYFAPGKLWAKYAHPMWVGFFVTLIVTTVVTIFTKPKFYGMDHFNPQAPSKMKGLAQSNAANISNFQTQEHKKAMQQLMRPSIGSQKWKCFIEKRHRCTTPIAKLIFPHIVD